MQLKEAVPWGRLASEYLAMFALTPQNLNRRLLDCAGGPSSFTAEMTQQGKKVISCDPLYQFSDEQIRQQIADTYPRMTALTEASRDNFLWHEFGSPAQLGQMRMRAMRLFLADYVEGQRQGRYVVGELPHLPFPPDSFDLALCSHFLFTYSEQFSTDFHIQSLLDIARVAKEVRVFPLLAAFTGELSLHLPAVMETLRGRGYDVEVRRVAYEFQKGGNKMLVVQSTKNSDTTGE